MEIMNITAVYDQLVGLKHWHKRLCVQILNSWDCILYTHCLLKQALYTYLLCYPFHISSFIFAANDGR